MSLEFEPLQIEPASRKVAAALLARITDRTLAAGDRLPSELELARQFGVNRSTLREALRELETNGLLRRERGSKLMMVMRPHTQAIASGVSRALALHDVTVHDVYEGLTILEPSIAEIAAARCDEYDMLRIKQAADNFAQHQNRDAGNDDASHEAAEFFRSLGEAAQNRVLRLAHEPLLQLLEPSLAVMIDKVPQARQRIASAQKRITNAIRERDAEAARSWTAKHIRDFRRGFDLAGIDLQHRVG